MFEGKLKDFSGIIVVLLLITLIGFTSCKKAENVIEVGVVLPLTGQQSYFGERAKQGLGIALSKINKKLEKRNERIHLVYGDSKGSNKEAVTVANKLLSVDNVPFIISLFPTCPAINGVTKNENVLHFACDMHPSVHEPENTFRIYPSQISEADKIIKYTKQVSAKKVAVLYLPTKGFQEEVKEYMVPELKSLDCKIMEETIPFNVKDIRSQALKIKEFKPDLIVLLILPNFHEVVLSGLNEVNLLKSSKVIGSISFLYSQAPEDLYEGIVFVAPDINLKEAVLDSSFEQNFYKKYNKKPGNVAAFVHDNLLILGDAIVENGNTPDKVKEFLINKETFSGVTGKIKIKENGDSEIPLTFGIIKSGKRNLLKFK